MEYSLSVIIPNYNNSKYLPACIDSILKQSYTEIKEIIIVDDCSTDDSRQIIEEYSLKHDIIKPIFLPQNRKVSFARNTGLKYASGNYVTCIDADDVYINPDKIKNEMSVIKAYKDQNIDVATYSRIVFMSNDGKNLIDSEKISKAYLNGRVYKALLRDVRSTSVMRDYCVSKGIIEKIGGYNEDNALFEDFELILKIAREIMFIYTGETGTGYRDSLSGLSKKSPELLRNKKNEIILNQLSNEKSFFRTRLKLEYKIIQILKMAFRKIVQRGSMR